MNRRWRGLWLGGIAALIGLASFAVAPLARLDDDIGLPWLFGVRGPVPAPEEVVIVAIDEASAARLGFGERPRTWPRSAHARLVDALAKAGASVVCFDLTFDTPSSSPADDAAFAASIARAGNVLLTAAVRRETTRLATGAGRPAEMVLDKTTPPIEALERAALGSAPFLLPKQARVNTYWTFRGDAADAPTLPVAALHAHRFAAFGEFVEVVRRTTPSTPLTRPADISDLLKTEAGAETVSVLRDVLGTDGSYEAVLDRLHRSDQSGNAADNKRPVAALARLYASDDVSYLNFYGPPRSIRTIPYASVLQASDAASLATEFGGKAVFVGYSAATPTGQDRLRDDYRTVYSRADGVDVSGVEIAATAFANLLDDRALRPLPWFWQSLLLSIWGLLLGVAAVLRGPRTSVAAVAMLVAAYLWLASERFADAALMLPLVVPLGIQAPFALLSALWMKHRDTLRERAAIQHVFGYFLPKAVVDRLARNLGPVTQDNSVVFGVCLATDVEKYTTLAESMEPGDLGRLMNSYYAELFEPVERRGGVVVDVVGDAMIAIWSAASAGEERRADACRAALEAIDRFDRSPHAAASLPTRFGLHAGDMLVGSIGASQHYEYRAVGDVVNTASRIQNLNKLLGTRLLASAETVRGLDGFAVRPVGSFLMAGKKNAVAVVELLGNAGSLDRDATDRYAAFAEALDAYRGAAWGDALHRFSTILETTPGDGPSRFYADRCRHLLSNPPALDWLPLIPVDTK